ncbi:MAG: chitinase [Clostridiales bacterium]|nr:chitinase [Clostridiales bacterium]
MSERRLIAYCSTANLKQITKEDAERLHSIHVAFGVIQNGKIYISGENIFSELKRVRRLNPNIRLVLSVGGWGADGFSQAASNYETRRRLVQSGVELIHTLDLDGIDIDWEYPCCEIAGIHADAADKENYTLLLKQFREALDAFSSYKILSIAAGAESYFLESTRMDQAEQYLDYVQLMTYDFRGSMRTLTGHHANLCSYEDVSEASADRSVQIFCEAGVPRRKLVLGAAFYGRRWYGVKDSSEKHGLGCEAESAGSTFLGYGQIEAMLNDFGHAYRKYHDERAQAAWLYNGESFISYEDAHALELKAHYTRENGLYGLMYWEYGLDETHTLTKLLYDAIQEP